MLLFVKKGTGIVFQTGKLWPEFYRKVSNPDGIYFCPTKRESFSFPPWKELAEFPRICIGNPTCQLKCPYCYMNGDPEMDAPLKTVKSEHDMDQKVDGLNKLISWIAKTSRYSLSWVFGEPFLPTNFEFLSKLIDSLPPEVREKCLRAGLFTNGVGFVSKPYPDVNIRASYFWTVRLIGKDDKSHWSVETNFDDMLRAANHFKQLKSSKIIRVMLPTHLPLSEVNPLVMDNLFRVYEASQANHLEPLYAHHVGEEDKYHSTYYPNIPDFITKKDHRGYFTEDPEIIGAMGRHSGYRKINPTKDSFHTFILPDKSTIIDVNDLQESYLDVISKISPQWYAPNPECLSCEAIVACSRTRQGKKKAGEAACLQLRDSVLTPIMGHGYYVLNKIMEKIYG